MAAWEEWRRVAFRRNRPRPPRALPRPPRSRSVRSCVRHDVFRGRRQQILQQRVRAGSQQTVSSPSPSVSVQELTGTPGPSRTFSLVSFASARLVSRSPSQITPPAAFLPLDDEFYVLDQATGRIRPNVDLLKKHFFHEGRLSHSQALWILEQATDLMSREANLIHVSGPVIGTPFPFSSPGQDSEPFPRAVISMRGYQWPIRVSSFLLT